MSFDIQIMDKNDIEEGFFEDDIHFVLDKEKSLLNKRTYYFDVTEDQAEKAATPSQETSDIDVDELLPSLDLLGIFDDEPAKEEIQATSSAIPAADHEQNLDCLLEDLDLFDLFDDETTDEEDTDCDENTPSLYDLSTIITETSTDSFNELDGNDSYDQDEDVVDDDDYDFMEMSEESYDDEVDWYDLEDSNIENTREYWADGLSIDVSTKITRDERAFQVACDIRSQGLIDDDEIEAIAAILESNGWGACKLALERQLNNGVSVVELTLASEIKELWLSHYEFYRLTQTNFHVMSWPLAVSILKSFGGIPDIEEIEVLLERLFYHWSYDAKLKNSYHTFMEYLFGKFFKDHSRHYSLEWEIGLASYYDEEDYLPPAADDIHSAVQHFYPINHLANVRSQINFQ